MSNAIHMFSSHHVGVAAEAVAAALFARCGMDISVQYGANQPEYDLIVARGEKLLKVSVKGSKDGRWGLTQSHLKDADYHAAIDVWLKRHKLKTIFCFVQFKNVAVDEMPRVYLATPTEIGDCLRMAAKGRGDTILHENHAWGARAVGAGTVEKLPEHWKFSAARVEQLLDLA
jgi:Holliday junction resolvase-like predicted endonuclease